MKLLLQIILLLNIFLIVTCCVSAKEYRDIVPFHSTKEDVVRLLGKPASWRFSEIYDFENERVHIFYSSDLDVKYHECIKQLPHDTVMLIEVTPKEELQLSDLQIDERSFRKFEPSYPPNIGFLGYIDEEQGLIIRTYEGKIDQIDYIAAKKDRNLCPSYRANPESNVHIIVDFLMPELIDEFSTFDEIGARIDNFYLRLNKNQSARGVIINYGTNREITIRKAKIIKVIKSHKFDLSRIECVFGSMSKGFKTELYLVPPGSEGPTPRP